jgi:hypothetical protein
MVELPKGEVSETRRGGTGVLELLLVDMQKRVESGYLRCEVGALGGAVGQITVRDGIPSMALYEGEDGQLLIAHVALGAMQEAAALEGSRLTRHSGVDLDLIEDLHPLARLYFDEGETLPWGDGGEAEVWWQRRQRVRREWKRLDAWMPEETPEDDSHAVFADLPPLPFHPGSELLPGMVAIVDAASPAESMAMVAHLGGIGHPLLVLSRMPTQRLEQEAGLPAASSVWLTEKGEGENVLNPTLEEVRRSIDAFLFGSKRACILLDGMEFLAGMHGFDRTLDLIRTLVDTVTIADHLLLIPVDLDVFDAQERAVLLREVDCLDAARVARWAARPARLEGHPFCSDDWASIEVPAPIVAAPAAPATAPTDSAAHRWSISGVVDAWREERMAEVADVHIPTAEAADVNLPEWATLPSANRDEVETEPAVNSAPAPVVEDVEAPTPVPEPQPMPPPVSLPVPSKGPKAATVNHRGNAKRQVRPSLHTKDGLLHISPTEVGAIAEQDSNRLTKQGMDFAADRAGDVEAKVDLPGEVISRRDGLDSAAGQARLIHGHGVEDDSPDLRVMGMDAASRAAAGSDIVPQVPALTSNPAARDASSRAQRTQHLTDRLAELEKASIRNMHTAFSGSSGDQVTVWKRIRNLQDLGVDVQPIIDRFESDPEGAHAALKEAEG